MSDQHSDRPAEVDADLADAASGRADLVTQLRQLEAFVERSEAQGDQLPPEATEMVARLREIVQALDGLTASMTDSARAALPDQSTSSPDP